MPAPSLALLALFASGCSWAQVRYHEGAADAAILRCHRAEDDPHVLECWDYFGARVRVKPRLGDEVRL